MGAGGEGGRQAQSGKAQARGRSRRKLGTGKRKAREAARAAAVRRSGSPVGAVPGQPRCSGRGRRPVRSSSVTPTPCGRATPGLPSVLRILRTGCPVQRTKRVPVAMSLFICPFVLSPECLPGARDTGTGAPAPQSGGDTEQQRARTARRGKCWRGRQGRASGQELRGLVLPKQRPFLGPHPLPAPTQGLHLPHSLRSADLSQQTILGQHSKPSFLKHSALFTEFPFKCTQILY